jgi:hypothetical protein
MLFVCRHNPSWTIFVTYQEREIAMDDIDIIAEANSPAHAIMMCKAAAFFYEADFNEAETKRYLEESNSNERCL